MQYVPEFVCPHCGESKASQVSGETGVFLQCGCKEAMDAWEKSHREAMERRKKFRVPTRKKR
jgi:hypothetical protein